jgi:hypothetical protein
MSAEMMQKATLVGGEAAIVLLFKSAWSSKTLVEDRIPINQQLDTLICEMAFKYGRADIVIFHVDGSASVIEAKDGTKGLYPRCLRHWPSQSLCRAIGGDQGRCDQGAEVPDVDFDWRLAA